MGGFLCRGKAGGYQAVHWCGVGGGVVGVHPSHS